MLCTKMCKSQPWGNPQRFCDTLWHFIWTLCHLCCVTLTEKEVSSPNCKSFIRAALPSCAPSEILHLCNVNIRYCYYCCVTSGIPGMSPVCLSACIIEDAGLRGEARGKSRDPPLNDGCGRCCSGETRSSKCGKLSLCKVEGRETMCRFWARLM